MVKPGAVQDSGYQPQPANPAENNLPPRRKLLLDTIRRAGVPLQPREIAKELNLHLNTVRDHLAALTEAGLLVRNALPHVGRGRPAIAYTSPPEDTNTPDRRVARALIIMLLNHLDNTSPAPEAEARRMGEEMGRYIAGTVNTIRPFHLELLRLAQEWGFTASWANPTTTLTLGKCPLTIEGCGNCRLIPEIHAGILGGFMEGIGRDSDTYTITIHKDGTSVLHFHPKGAALPVS